MNNHPYADPPESDEAVLRRQSIVEFVGTRTVGSQAELLALLAERGFTLTQATLSRDLKTLGIGKVPSEVGYVYKLMSGQSSGTAAVPLEIAAFVSSIRAVGNLVLIRTAPGNANGVGRAVDGLGWAEVEGTISGDDTVLVVTASRARGKSFVQKLSALAGRT